MLEEDICMFRELGAEGVVVGCLKPEGDLDTVQAAFLLILFFILLLPSTRQSVSAFLQFLCCFRFQRRKSLAEQGLSRGRDTGVSGRF